VYLELWVLGGLVVNVHDDHMCLGVPAQDPMDQLHEQRTPVLHPGIVLLTNLCQAVSLQVIDKGKGYFERKLNDTTGRKDWMWQRQQGRE
jgi:hypothetical protein